MSGLTNPLVCQWWVYSSSPLPNPYHPPAKASWTCFPCDTIFGHYCSRTMLPLGASHWSTPNPAYRALQLDPIGQYQSVRPKKKGACSPSAPTLFGLACVYLDENQWKCYILLGEEAGHAEIGKPQYVRNWKEGAIKQLPWSFIWRQGQSKRSLSERRGMNSLLLAWLWLHRLLLLLAWTLRQPWDVMSASQRCWEIPLGPATVGHRSRANGTLRSDFQNHYLFVQNWTDVLKLNIVGVRCLSCKPKENSIFIQTCSLTVQ